MAFSEGHFWSSGGGVSVLGRTRQGRAAHREGMLLGLRCFPRDTGYGKI